MSAMLPTRESTSAMTVIRPTTVAGRQADRRDHVNMMTVMTA